MIDDKNGHKLSPLIMFTCMALRHALLEWQRYTRVHPKASKARLKADRPDLSNYFNCKNDGRTIVFCSAVTGCKMLTSRGIADMYTFLMNPWNTLRESYQQRMYNNTLATVKRQIQQVENPTHAVVVSVEATRVENAILLDCLTSEVAIAEPEIGSTIPNILIDNNCTDDQPDFGIPGGRGCFEDEGDESDVIPTASWHRWAKTALERFDMGTSDVDWYQGDDGNDANEEAEALPADDGSTQNVED
jgi:hypothetical protein